MGMLSHKEMKASILAKGVVMMPDGRIISRVEDLPTEGDIAKLSGDPAKLDAAEATLDAQIRALQEAKAKLRDSAATPTDADPEPAKADTPKTPPLGQAKAAPANVTVAPTKPQEPAKK